MMRGPVLPQLRDGLWSLVSARFDRIETGLSLVLEGLDCSDGQLGLVDGLARDAVGAPVLVLLAVEGDSLLPARALAAGQFLQRVGDGLTRAVPEANFCPDAVGRVLLVGTDAAGGLLDQVRRLPIDRLQVCALEPFRIAGSERFAVRWLLAPDHAAGPASPAGAGEPAGAVATAATASPANAMAAAEQPPFVVPDERAELWRELQRICAHIDPAVRAHGDRYSRRITWNGHELGELRTVGGALIARSGTGLVLDLRDTRDVRRFGDQLLRAFAGCAGLDVSSQTESNPSVVLPAARTAATRHPARSRVSPSRESLRTSLAAAKLSPEEYSALEGSAAVAGDAVEGSVLAEDRQQASPSRET